MRDNQDEETIANLALSHSATEDKAQPTATTNMNAGTQDGKRAIRADLGMNLELVKVEVAQFFRRAVQHFAHLLFASTKHNCCDTLVPLH